MIENNPRVGVGVFVFRGGKFLVQKRQGAHGEGTWSLPGGHLEFGESWEDAAVREVSEEAGCKITNIAFGAVTNDIFTNENKQYVTIWITSDWQSGEPTIREPEKCTEQAWVDFDSLPKQLFKPWKQLVSSEFYKPLRQQCKDRRKERI